MNQSKRKHYNIKKNPLIPVDMSCSTNNFWVIEIVPKVRNPEFPQRSSTQPFNYGMLHMVSTLGIHSFIGNLLLFTDTRKT